MARQTIIRDRHNSTLPTTSFPERLNPICLCSGVLLPDVIDPTARAIIEKRKYDSGSNILDVAACPSPASLLFLQKDGWTSISHTLEVRPQAMMAVARAKNGRKTKNRSEHLWIAQGHTLDQNFVVSILVCKRQAFKRPIRI